MKPLGNLFSSLLVFLLLLLGCATHPVAVEDSKEISANHLIPALLGGATTSMEDGGKIVITRDAGLSGSASLIKIFIDGIPVAKLTRYERYEVILKEGEYVLGATPTIGASLTGVRELSANIKRGQTLYYRVGYDASGLVFQRTALTH